ncbi:MAG TPA: cytochrome c peroxidase [Candidatus Cybelea sp.]|nr:cytochrome c peroxidase [Candidatus Cybelea sp.]
MAVALCACFAWPSRAADGAPGPGTNTLAMAKTREPIRPIPQSLPLDAAKAALGHKLFDEMMLSHDGTLSCASCHNLKTGGVDHRVHSIGFPAENLTRIFNYGFTTRKDGHGFGLHSGALAARELGGSLSAHSEGLRKGAMFTLELPCQTNKTAA